MQPVLEDTIPETIERWPRRIQSVCPGGDSRVNVSRDASNTIPSRMIGHRADCSRRERLRNTSTGVIRFSRGLLEYIQTGDHRWSKTFPAS